MCRLTLVYPKKPIDPKFSALVTSLIVANNSTEVGQNDGAGIGILDDKTCRYIKTAKPGYEYLFSDKWEELINDKWENELNETTKFMGHARQATVGISVSSDNSHPFIVDQLMGVHNGSIRNKDTFDKDSESDSEAFFKYLAKQVNGKPLTYKILKDALEKIRGAFCMLINDQNNDVPSSVWVVVGKNRELYIMENDNYIIINTSKTAFTSVYILYNSLKMLGDERYKLIEFDSIPVKMTPETIFFISNGEVEEVGDVKENDTTVASVITGAARSFTSAGSNVKTARERSSRAREAARLWAEITEISGSALDEAIGICNLFHNKEFLHWPLFSVEELEEVLAFLKYLDSNGYTQDIDKKADVWDKITNSLYANFKTIHNYYSKIVSMKGDKANFMFPYWLNSLDSLVALQDELVAPKEVIL